MKKVILLLYLFTSVFVLNAQRKTGTIVWKYSTAGEIATTACIDNTKIFIGSDDGNFYCNDIENGKLLWKYSTGKVIRSSATVANDKVFFGCDDGNIYALNENNGALVWKFATKGEKTYDMWDYYRSSPAFFNNKIYVGSGDGNIYALDASNGKELWHYTTNGIVHADPVVSNDTVFAGSFDGNFYALNATTGALIWKFKTVGDRFFPKGEIQKAALVTSDAVYFGSRDYNIYALNKSNGAGLWDMKEYGSWIVATPIEKDGKLFFGTSDSHTFYSLNNFYGEVQWKTALSMRSYDTPVSYDTLIFAGCFNGYLYGFGEKTGNIEWSFQTDGSKQNYYTVYDSTGNFRKDFPTYGNDSVAAAAEHKIMQLGGVLSSPIIKNGVVFFGSTDGKLYAIKIG